MCRQNKDEDQRLYLSKSIIIIKIDNNFFIIDFFIYLCIMIDTGIKLKTKVEIIEETTAFYNFNNRAIDDNDECVYFEEYTGNRCAVGRCLNYDADLGYYNTLTNASDLFEELGFDILKSEYRIEDLNFWTDLQLLHDDPNNWDKNGISEKGIEYKYKLLQKYGN